MTKIVLPVGIYDKDLPDIEQLNALFIPCYVDGLPYESGSVTWRAKWPAKYWHTPDPILGFQPGFADVFDGSQHMGDYNVFVFQKAYRSKKAQLLLSNLSKIRDHVDERRIVLILDMCDPDWLDVPTRDKLLTLLPHFDIATAPTQPLVDWMGQYLPAHVVEDGIDLDDISSYHDYQCTRKPSVCWFGYEGNFNIEPIAQDLVKVGADVEVIFVEKPVPFAKFLQTISLYDILLNPRSSVSPHIYKSDNKSDAAWMAGVAVARKLGDLPILMDHMERKWAIKRNQAEIVSGRNALTSANKLFQAITGEIRNGPGND